MRRTALVAALVLASAAALPADARDSDDAPPKTPASLPAPRLVAERTGDARRKNLQRYGGNEATEKAVAAGLDWLARHQEPDGGWDADGFDGRCTAPVASDSPKPASPKDAPPEGGGPDTPAAPVVRCTGKGKGQHGEDIPCPFDGALSGLATLAFLAGGHGPWVDGDPYGEVVAKALERLAAESDVWTLPISLEVFAEAEALERKGRFRDRVDARVADLLRTRQEDGAWGYIAPWRPGSDVPYSVLCVQALVAARDAGARLPEDLAPRVDAWLTDLEESKGRLAYLKDGRSYGYTPTSSNAHCAVAIRELLGVARDGARHRAHTALLGREPPVWKIEFRTMDVPGRGKVPVQVGNLSMYQWWHGTVGMFQRGGEGWTTWFSAARTALVGHQRRDGCAKGSWDPEGQYERIVGGRVFATALGVLTLAQPCRHRRLSETTTSGSK